MIVLGAGGVILGAAALVGHNWWHFQRLVLVGAAWAASAGAFFLLAWPKFADLRDVIEGQDVYTVPFPPASFDDAEALARRAGDVLEAGFGFHGRPWSTLIVIASALFALAGGIALARRDRVVAALLVAPFAAAAAAVAADFYPFATRFVLFLVPFVVILVAAGTAAALEDAAKRRRARRPIAGAAVIAAASPVAAAGLASVRITTRQPEQDIKPVLDDLRAAWRPGDVLYLHAGSQYAARFYAEVDGVHRSSAGETLWPVVPTVSAARGGPALRSAPPMLLVERFRAADGSTFTRDLASLDGRPRVWFVFSQVVRFERNAIVTDLDRHIAALDVAGTRRTTIQHGSARALLYDLGG
jgi:hypothetical protein